MDGCAIFLCFFVNAAARNGRKTPALTSVLRHFCPERSASKGVLILKIQFDRALFFYFERGYKRIHIFELT
jgi:hypothetical protein